MRLSGSPRGAQQLGAEVFGFSTQTTEYQKMVERLRVPFEVLSDADLAFVRALRLPTFDIKDMTLVKRFTLAGAMMVFRTRTGRSDSVFISSGGCGAAVRE